MALDLSSLSALQMHLRWFNLVVQLKFLELLPDAVVEDALGFCDANSKMHDFVAEYLQVPRFFTNKFGSSEKEYEL